MNGAGGSMSVRIESFYCRSCGSHNVINAAANEAAAFSQPTDDSDVIDDVFLKTDLAGSRQALDQVLTSAFPVPLPTILKGGDDDPIDEQDAATAAVAGDEEESYSSQVGVGVYQNGDSRSQFDTIETITDDD